MKYFEKIDKDLLNNRFLTANEKIIYVICYSYKNAPYGCRVSHKYLMQRTGIKTKKTLIRCLDNLSLYGLLARKQIGQGSNDYVFDKPTMQEYIQHNINKRKKNLVVSKYKKQGSGMISSIIFSDGILEIPEDVNLILKNDYFKFYLFEHLFD